MTRLSFLTGSVALHTLVWSAAALLYSAPLRSDSVARQQESALFVIERGGKFGFARLDGTVAISPRFDGAKAFSAGFAPVRMGDCWRYVNSGGAAAAETCYEDAESFSEGFAAIRKGGRWGFITADWKEAIPPRYEATRPFSSGFAAVRRGGRWFFLGRDGEEGLTVAGGYRGAESFGEGLAPVNVDGKWGFIDLTGKMVIDPAFSDAKRFANGVAPARKGGPTDLFGFIKRDGSWAIPPRYMSAEPFSEGAAAVSVDSLFGFIDTGGREIVTPSLLQAGSFQNGLATVTDQYNWASYVNRRGELVMRRNEHKGGGLGAGGLLPVRLQSTPVGAAVYLIPRRAWEKDSARMNASNARMLLFRVPEGATQVETRVAEKVYVALFVLKGQRESRVVDVSRLAPERLVSVTFSGPGR
jgi:hypothetical protein